MKAAGSTEKNGGHLWMIPESTVTLLPNDIPHDLVNKLLMRTTKINNNRNSMHVVVNEVIDFRSIH